MSNIVLKAENISKQYRLGQLGTGTISHDLNRAWAKMRGKEDPYLKVGDANDRSKAGGSDYVWSLKDINLDVNRGDVLGIIGKNGAGKSTLLKILSQVTAPTTGQVKVKGRIAALLEVGTGFHPDLSGRDNIFLNGAILGMTKHEIKNKLDEIVEFSGVAKYLDTPVKRYSSGMMVRLGFAVAAHLEPEILIVDEVLAVGDAEFQKKCLGKMKDVSEHGRTVLFVSHNMAAVSALCKSAICLKNGRVDFKGSVEETLTHYLSTQKNNYNGFVNFDGSESERFGEKQWAKWKSLKLMNKNNEVSDVFRMGETMRIELDLDVFKTSDDFEIGIGFGNLQEIFSQYFLGNWEGVSAIKREGPTKISIEIPQVLMFPGNYLINIWICVKGAYYDDAVHNAINFRVEEGKVNQFDTYFERFSKGTQVYTKSNWEIK